LASELGNSALAQEFVMFHAGNATNRLQAVVICFQNALAEYSSTRSNADIFLRGGRFSAAKTTHGGNLDNRPGAISHGTQRVALYAII
jgi:hypothetical protein